MGYAAHIGRVGALAVVLGIGVAVANTPGVAWAEPTDSGSSVESGNRLAPGTSPPISLQSQTANRPQSRMRNPPTTQTTLTRTTRPTRTPTLGNTWT